MHGTTNSLRDLWLPDRAVFIQISKEDSLFLHADTISAITVTDTSASGYRLMRAYYDCRIFSKNLQAKCDSLSYSFQGFSYQVLYMHRLYGQRKISLQPIQWRYLQKTGRQTGWNCIILLL